MRKDAYETVESGRYYAEIVIDTDPGESPRDWDNLGTMVCFHNRYNLGDTVDNGHHSHILSGKGENTFRDVEDFSEWLEENKEDIAVILPLCLYDHSGISMSCGRGYPYNDRWDSSQVGYIFVTKEELKKEYSKKICTSAIKKTAEKVLRSEVDVYSQYLTGEVYGYRLYRLTLEDGMELDDNDNPEDYGEELDSCYGYYGLDDLKKEITSTIKYYQEKDDMVQHYEELGQTLSTATE
jgi:hypothetical protein